MPQICSLARKVNYLAQLGWNDGTKQACAPDVGIQEAITISRGDLHLGRAHERLQNEPHEQGRLASFGRSGFLVPAWNATPVAPGLSSRERNSGAEVAAIFDADKFKWVNGHHVRRLTDDEVGIFTKAVLFGAWPVQGAVTDWKRVERSRSRQGGQRHMLFARTCRA